MKLNYFEASIQLYMKLHVLAVRGSISVSYIWGTNASKVAVCRCVGYLYLKEKEVVSDVASVHFLRAEVLYPRLRYLSSG